MKHLKTSISTAAGMGLLLGATSLSHAATLRGVVPVGRSISNTNYSAKVFDFNALMELVTPTMTSVDQIIPLLPDSYKKYFTVMFRSHSLQNASPSLPRVVAYGSHDNLDPILGGTNLDQLYLAFQTDPSGPYAQSLEAIEWVPRTKSFQFYQIDFPITPTSVTKNPESCKICHGTPSRPNWSAYPRWDGALGNNNSLDGKFIIDQPEVTAAQAQSLFDTLKKNSDRLKTFDFSMFLTQTLEYPNAYMSDKISSELKPRDVLLIRKLPDYPKLKYAFAGAFLECSNFDQFFSPQVINQFKQGVFEHMKSVPTSPIQIVTADMINFDRLLKSTFPLLERNGVHLGEAYDNEVYITTWLRFILEGSGQEEFLRNILGNPLNKTASDPSWTYDFVGFSDRITGLRDQFLADAAKDFPSSMLLYPNLVLSPNDSSNISVVEDPSGSCKKLATMSLKATEGYDLTPKPVLSPIPSGKPMTGLALFKNYCTTCHGSGANTLPLDDAALLKSYRTKKGVSITDRLVLKEMPPVYAPRPTVPELKSMLDLLK